MLSDFPLKPDDFGNYVMRLWILLYLLFSRPSPCWGIAWKPAGCCSAFCWAHWHYFSKCGVLTHTALFQTGGVEVNMSPLAPFTPFWQKWVTNLHRLVSLRGDIRSVPRCWTHCHQGEGTRGLTHTVFLQQGGDRSLLSLCAHWHQRMGEVGCQPALLPATWFCLVDASWD